MLIGIDPGVRKGLAVSVFNPFLEDAFMLYPLSSYAAYRIEEVVNDYVHQLKNIFDRDETEFVLERPVYRGVYGKDIVELSLISGGILGAFPTKVATYTSKEWKGEVPKTVHHDRVERALLPQERLYWPPRSAKGKDVGNDVRDAICLGMFATKRTRRGGEVS